MVILLAGDVSEEDAAVAGVYHVAAGMVEGARAEGGGADEPSEETIAGEFQVEEEAQHGRHPVERAIAAEEGGVGEEAAPGLADGRAANEAPRVVRREAEEDLRDDVVRQIQQRAAAQEFRRRRRGHGCYRRGVWGWGEE